LYTIKGKAALNFNSLEKLLVANKDTIKSFHSYARRKTIRWGVNFERKNILKYYHYKLIAEEGGNYVPILTNLAAGDSSKLYVS
jgi:hypothetical protein